MVSDITPELALHLQELVDRHQIREVLTRYARGLDRMEDELVRSCYFDDAIEDHGHYVGYPDGFVTWANEVSLRFVSTQHGLLNHYCELDGDDAYCETYYLFSGTYATPPHFMATGRYIDHFQKRNGEWRIANRVSITEGSYDIPQSILSAAMPSPYRAGETCPATRNRDDVSYHRPVKPRPPREDR